MRPLTDFLLKNGFTEYGDNGYKNQSCTITIIDDTYHVKNTTGDTMYSKDLNLYWLIGVLTYYGFMKKDYIS
jgi:hypothetical protein